MQKSCTQEAAREREMGELCRERTGKEGSEFIEQIGLEL